MDWNAIKPELEKKLDPSHVVKPTGKYGPKGDYLEGWFVIQEANRIFGHGGWSYEIDLTQNALVEGKDRNGKPQWQAAYTCVCTLHVDTVYRQDVGFGSGFAATIGDAIEGATKEAATDALKRALRTFGNPFGLALYDKKRENVGRDEPEFVPTAARDRIKASLTNARTIPDLERAWKDNKKTIEALPEPMQLELKKSGADRRSALGGNNPQAPEANGHISGAMQ